LKATPPGYTLPVPSTAARNLIQANDATARPYHPGDMATIEAQREAAIAQGFAQAGVKVTFTN
jgi:hypothetical protein